MTGIYINIIGFIISASIIVYGGTKLSIYGDKIADFTGLGKAWVGLVLMSSVTSLPELITGLSAVTIVDAPDLAAGDIFGSCVFNLLILSVLDVQVKKPLLSVVKSGHIVAAILGIILLAIVGVAIYLSGATPNLLWINSFTFIIMGAYFLSVWGIFKYENDAQKLEPTKVISHNKSELKNAIVGYILHAMVVIAAAIFLPYFGDHIATYSGMEASFFGTLFIAAATSLPELVVSLSALRIGSLDMAVGNLLGSNIFNMFILGIDDVFYTKGSLFSNISQAHLLSVLVTIIMSAAVGLGLIFKPTKKHFLMFSFDTLIVIILYISLMIYLYLH
jgi:cation:H+ antiporter